MVYLSSNSWSLLSQLWKAYLDPHASTAISQSETINQDDMSDSSHEEGLDNSQPRLETVFDKIHKDTQILEDERLCY